MKDTISNKYYGAMALLMTSAPMMALAQKSSSANAMDRLVSSQEKAGDFVNLVLVGFFLAGLVCTGFGLYKIVEKSQNPNSQTKWGSVIMMIIGGGLMMSLQFISGDLVAWFQGDNEIARPKANFN